MKKALVILKDGTIVEVEYNKVNGKSIIWDLVNQAFVNFAKNTFACDTIARIEWID